MKRPDLTADDGFTFIETLLVLTLTIILTAGIGLSSIGYIEKAKRLAAQTQIETFRIALQTWYLDCGTYPSGEQGLEALFAKPVLSPVPDDWQGPYLAKQVEADPWGNDYRYGVPGPDGLPYSIVSTGADGCEGGTGNDSDICSWK